MDIEIPGQFLEWVDDVSIQPLTMHLTANPMLNPVKVSWSVAKPDTEVARRWCLENLQPFQALYTHRLSRDFDYT